MVTEAWRNSKDSKKKDIYWKSAKTWEFDMNTGETLQLFALTKNNAIRMAREHERWLHKKGFKKDKVLLNKIKERKFD